MKRDRCGARTRAGTACRRWPLKGRKRCALHGGRTPIKHGLYSGRPVSERLQELEERHLEREDAEHTWREIAKARALLDDWLNRYGELTDALMAWYADHRRGGPLGLSRPANLPDVSSAVVLLEHISKAAKRERDTANANWISRRDLARLLREILEVLKRHADGQPLDAEKVEAIRQDWLKLAVR